MVKLLRYWVVVVVFVIIKKNILSNIAVLNVSLNN